MTTEVKFDINVLFFYRSLGLFTDKDVYSKQEGNIQGSKNVIYMQVKIK